MQEMGALALDAKNSQPKAGDRLAVPLNNTSLSLPDEAGASQLEPISIVGPRELTTWSGGAGAGFYASTRGPLPSFALGHVPPEKVLMFEFHNVPASPAKK